MLTPGLYVLRPTFNTLVDGMKLHVAFNLSKPYLEKTVVAKQFVLLECSYVSGGRRVAPKILLPDGQVGWVWEGELNMIFWDKVE